MFDFSSRRGLGQVAAFRTLPGQGSVTCILCLVAWLVAENAILAKPPHRAAVMAHYGDHLPEKLHSCQLCHLSEQEIGEASPKALGDSTKPWNAFGYSLYLLGKEQVAQGAARPANILERIQQLSDEDADGDGVANEIEMFAGTFPGVASDRPDERQLAAAQHQFMAWRNSQKYAWRPFEAVSRPPAAKLDDPRMVNPIDAFIAKRQREEGIVPRPPASKEILLRRVYLDLIGLPPTREELSAFLADDSSEAYAKVVDRLLASPQYGERWGRHWMDIWRYSDWAGWGEQVRDSHPHIWRWRDWIIESLNEDKPYDQMILEMLAADEFAPSDEDALRATGFLVRNYKRLSREQWMMDTVDHAGRAFLGLTFKCAQCHDHMYDPLLQEEYFQFRAIFEPYLIRVDPIDGVLDTQQMGLARAHDGNPDAKTLFYLRGDERTPDPDREIVPGVPVFLGGGPLEAIPIDLTYTQYYPSLRPEVLASHRQQAKEQVDRSQEALQRAEAEYAGAMESLLSARLRMSTGQSLSDDAGEEDVASLEKGASDAEVALAIARQKHASAVSLQAALHARIAAEEAKYGAAQESEATWRDLARSASRLEKQAKLAQAEWELLEAQHALTSLETESAGERDRRGKLGEARRKVDERRARRDEIEKEASKEDEDYSALGEVYPTTSSGRRLALARWIADAKNPLTARVAVNHLWSRHFGQGLVDTVDDFGGNGQPSRLPDLHDWLAAELMEPTHGLETGAAPAPWSMKHIHRLIVLSRTYQLDSSYDAEVAQRDSDNRYHWRWTSRRLEAEAVRDSILHVAGGLDLRMGGQELDHRQVLSIPRRSIYFRHAPEKQAQFLQIFDVAAPSECYQRRDSIIPQQALALVNSELTISESRRLARRLWENSGANQESFVVFAFEQVLGRYPTNQERSACEEFLIEREKAFKNQDDDQGTTDDGSDLKHPSSNPRLRAAENLVHALFNHHEFVTLR